ncbi:hypothetical protein LCGC14_2410670, partial [marine sediment metagenome]
MNHPYSSSFVPNGRKNSLEITCCSSLLSKVFKEWFGCGAKNKRLPSHLFCLSNKQIKHVVDGYFDGDGYQKTATRKVSASISKQWSMQLFDILNRFRLYPAITLVKRENRQPVYTISWFDEDKKTPGRIGRYENGYYCIPVVQKRTRQHSSLVYNLTVNPQHSYV